MQRVIIVVIAFFLLTSIGFANTPFTEFKVGQYNPKDAKAGTIFGLNLGRMIDESISWSFELNYFQKSYDKNTVVYKETSPGGNTFTEVQTEVAYKTRIIPLFLKLNYEHPLAHRSPFYARASAGLGWELLWNKEDNYEEDYHKTRFFNGFGWTANAGVGFEISSSTNLFADLFYNGSTVKRNHTKNENGLPTWQEMDITGLGLRVGVSIVGFGR